MFFQDLKSLKGLIERDGNKSRELSSNLNTPVAVLAYPKWLSSIVEEIFTPDMLQVREFLPEENSLCFLALDSFKIASNTVLLENFKTKILENKTELMRHIRENANKVLNEWTATYGTLPKYAHQAKQIKDQSEALLTRIAEDRVSTLDIRSICDIFTQYAAFIEATSVAPSTLGAKALPIEIKKHTKGKQEYFRALLAIEHDFLSPLAENGLEMLKDLEKKQVDGTAILQEELDAFCEHVRVCEEMRVQVYNQVYTACHDAFAPFTHIGKNPCIDFTLNEREFSSVTTGLARPMFYFRVPAFFHIAATLFQQTFVPTPEEEKEFRNKVLILDYQQIKNHNTAVQNKQKSSYKTKIIQALRDKILISPLSSGIIATIERCVSDNERKKNSELQQLHSQGTLVLEELAKLEQTTDALDDEQMFKKFVKLLEDSLNLISRINKAVEESKQENSQITEAENIGEYRKAFAPFTLGENPLINVIHSADSTGKMTYSISLAMPGLSEIIKMVFSDEPSSSTAENKYTHPIPGDPRIKTYNTDVEKHKKPSFKAQVANTIRTNNPCDLIAKSSELLTLYRGRCTADESRMTNAYLQQLDKDGKKLLDELDELRDEKDLLSDNDIIDKFIPLLEKSREYQRKVDLAVQSHKEESCIQILETKLPIHRNICLKGKEDPRLQILAEKGDKLLDRLLTCKQIQNPNKKTAELHAIIEESIAYFTEVETAGKNHEQSIPSSSRAYKK